jgi:hypothetical protein
VGVRSHYPKEGCDVVLKESAGIRGRESVNRLGWDECNHPLKVLRRAWRGRDYRGRIDWAPRIQRIDAFRSDAQIREIDIRLVHGVVGEQARQGTN